MTCRLEIRKPVRHHHSRNNSGIDVCRRKQGSRIPRAINRRRSTRQGDAMSFGLYSIGFAILIGGLIYAAHLVHMPAHWIVVGAVVLLGVGILSGVKATRQKDPPE